MFIFLGHEDVPVDVSYRRLKGETRVWLEITTLLIPGLNDSPQMLAEECDWIVAHLGRDVPAMALAARCPGRRQSRAFREGRFVKRLNKLERLSDPWVSRCLPRKRPKPTRM